MKYCKKCGNKIEHNLKRLLCLDCIRKENNECYNFKREIYNKARREKRKLKKFLDTRVCVVCKIEFKTSHAIKCTCSKECSRIHTNNLSKEAYKRKVKNAN